MHIDINLTRYAMDKGRCFFVAHDDSKGHVEMMGQFLGIKIKNFILDMESRVIEIHKLLKSRDMIEIIS